MTKVSHVAWRRSGAAAVTLAVLASLAGVADAGTRTAATAPLGRVPKPTALDYSPAPPGGFTPLSSKFVTEALGLSFPPPPAAAPAAVAGAAADNPPPPVVNAVTSRALHCVNGHQTEDPLSPPCVASFTGDNGGATYRGVSGDEIRILVVLSTSANLDVNELERAGLGQLRAPYGTYYDLGAPPPADENQLPVMRGLRALQAYFNHRYQLYGRRLRLVVYNRLALGGDTWAHDNALENDILVRPFAAMLGGADSTAPPPTEYQLTFAARGVPAFDIVSALTRRQAARYPSYLWGYRPSVENAAALYSSYVCQKVVGHPAVLSGNPGENGKPRRLGMLVPAEKPGDPLGDAARAMSELVKDRIRSCGGKIETVVENVETAGCGNSIEPANRVQIVSDLRRHGVTTVLSAGCNDFLTFGDTLTALDYFPEWILWGDGATDRNDDNFVSNNTAFNRHAIDVTPMALEPALTDRICFRAQTAEDPGIQPYTAADRACDVYEGLRQVVSAIQLAGPILTPKALDAGVRNAPAQTASGPQTPLCRYTPGDYTCVKDAQAEIWATIPSAAVGVDWPIAAPLPASGCWLAIDGGRRYAAGAWPAGNIDAQLTGKETCEQGGTIRAPR